MPKAEWGVKRTCPETSKRFYDLNTDPVVSPYTGQEYPLSFFTNDKSKTSMSDKADQSALKKAKEAETADNTDILANDDDEAGDANLGDDVLDDDDDEATVSLEEIADVPADESEN